jgi:flagellar motor protein MotB
MRRVSLGAFALLLASGCVSESKYEDMNAKAKDLAWRLEAAEKASKTEDAEKRTLLKKIEVLEEEGRVAREKLALANDALKDAKKDVDEELKARLAELQAKSPGKLELSPWGGVVLESGILFASGRHELTKDGEAALGPLVESLTSSKYDGYTVELSGHTDGDPLRATAKVYMDNHDLAAKRANSVRRFLIAKGVPANRIYLSAWGETRPLASEETKAGKAQNRRVEIRLHHEASPAEMPAVAKPGTDTTKPASAPKEGMPAEEPKAESGDAGDEIK